jgi:hypothetical protein
LGDGTIAEVVTGSGALAEVVTGSGALAEEEVGGELMLCLREARGETSA